MGTLTMKAVVVKVVPLGFATEVTLGQVGAKDPSRNELRVTVRNEVADEWFAVGKEHYLDFRPVK